MMGLMVCCMAWTSLSVQAGQKDSVQFSVLTCYPSSEIYRMFGHTALRYTNHTQHQDWVFNFGMFDFNAPHFIYHFVLGETDYQLGVEEYARFHALYQWIGARVTQQVLDLTEEEKARLLALLRENYLPRNRFYRYNYFHDNCTTRARDKIEAGLNGDVGYAGADGLTTYREMLHAFMQDSPWYRFGVDLLLGQEADRPITIRQQMFSPLFFHDSLSLARRADGRCLVQDETALLPGSAGGAPPGFPLSPAVCMWLLLVVTICMQYAGYRFHFPVNWVGYLLFFIQGLAGCIVAFLFFFSSHPTVGSNWMIGVLNPLPLLCLPWVMSMPRFRMSYHWANALVLLLLAVVMPLSPQHFDAAVWPMMAVLVQPSVSYIHLTLHRK